MAKGKIEYWLTDEGRSLITFWAKKGLSEDEIAHNMCISRSTLNNWKKHHEKIKLALNEGKKAANYIVENALFKRATGYEYYEEFEELKENDETGIKELTVVKRVKKHIAPDTVAQIYWLNNRMPKYWRNKPKDEVENSGVTVVFKNGNAEELAE